MEKKLKVFLCIFRVIAGICLAIAAWYLIETIEVLTAPYGQLGNESQHLITALIFMIVFWFLGKIVKRKIELVKSGTSEMPSYTNIAIMVAKDLFKKKK